MSSKNKYVKRDQVVVQELTFSINLFREGSWLYLKLFLGSILAFIISWLVFFISTEDFVVISTADSSYVEKAKN